MLEQLESRASPPGRHPGGRARRPLLHCQTHCAGDGLYSPAYHGPRPCLGHSSCLNQVALSDSASWPAKSRSFASLRMTRFNSCFFCRRVERSFSAVVCNRLHRQRVSASACGGGTFVRLRGKSMALNSAPISTASEIRYIQTSSAIPTPSEP